MNPHYSRVAERAGHRCEYCRAPEAIFNFAFEVEHIVPPSRGGTDDDSNRALSCRCCNVFKSDYLDGAIPRPGTRRRSLIRANKVGRSILQLIQQAAP